MQSLLFTVRMVLAHNFTGKSGTHKFFSPRIEIKECLFVLFFAQNA
jgi:hypothetical protein